MVGDKGTVCGGEYRCPLGERFGEGLAHLPEKKLNFSLK